MFDKKNLAISVIAPIYNTEKHLRKYLERIPTETCRDFEFITVNDGSMGSTDSISDDADYCSFQQKWLDALSGERFVATVFLSASILTLRFTGANAMNYSGWSIGTNSGTNFTEIYPALYIGFTSLALFFSQRVDYQAKC